MTNEELLAEIEKRILVAKGGVGGWLEGAQALQAIVELHKPFQFEKGPDEYKSVCSHCQLGVVGDIYPCPTIQAIEKELAYV